MIAVIAIQWWHWAIFVGAVLLFLALDLGVLNRRPRQVAFREALGWTALWVAVAMGFFCALFPLRGRDEALEFLTGYFIELSLSMDNVFVIALIFAHFRIPRLYQHRVLFWGLLGALFMRGVLIGAGAAAVSRFHSVLYLFGAFLMYTGIKSLVKQGDAVDPEKNLLVRTVRRFFPVTAQMEGEHFVARIDGRPALTPLALVLVMVETSDLVFAVDSLPAIFAVTQRPFIIFTSNVFAILGLRSLYVVLAGAIAFFRYLKFGLSAVLILIGIKMLIAPWILIGTPVALATVVTVILAAILCSLAAAWREKRIPEDPDPK
jgi:tellurite resistance protein TerC